MQSVNVRGRARQLLLGLTALVFFAVAMASLILPDTMAASLGYKLVSLLNVRAVQFCPEEFAFGVPRNVPDIHGGDGFDVLDGKAKVLTDKEEDWTAGFVAAANEMLRVAKAERVDLAILQNMSAACGTQVISDGSRLVPIRKFRRGPGVATALLMRNGFRVTNGLNLRTLEFLHKKLDPTYEIDATACNYDESEWYQSNFSLSPFNL